MERRQLSLEQFRRMENYQSKIEFLETFNYCPRTFVNKNKGKKMLYESRSEDVLKSMVNVLVSVIITVINLHTFFVDGNVIQ